MHSLYELLVLLLFRKKKISRAISLDFEDADVEVLYDDKAPVSFLDDIKSKILANVLAKPRLLKPVNIMKGTSLADIQSVVLKKREPTAKKDYINQVPPEIANFAFKKIVPVTRTNVVIGHMKLLREITDFKFKSKAVTNEVTRDTIVD